MKEYEIKNAVIKKADISTGDRGCLDAWLELDYGGTCQGFGGYALYLPKSWAHHNVLSVAGHHIYRIMELAGVEKWSQLPGKTIRVESSWTDIKRIGHIVKDDWYSPSADFEAARDILSNAEVRDRHHQGGTDNTESADGGGSLD